MKRSTKSNVAKPAHDPVKVQNGLLTSLDELFDDTQSSVTLTNGDKVEIVSAKVKHLRYIISFIEKFVSEFDQSQLVALIKKVSSRQEAKIDEGVSPYLLGTEAVVKELAGDAALILQLIAKSIDSLSPLVAQFSSLEEEQVEELELDDMAAVVFAIFGRNYHFFTRQVLPVILGSIERLQKKKS